MKTIKIDVPDSWNEAMDYVLDHSRDFNLIDPTRLIIEFDILEARDQVMRKLWPDDTDRFYKGTTHNLELLRSLLTIKIFAMHYEVCFKPEEDK